MLEASFRKAGFNMTYDDKVITGLYGCPQTRARLIVLCSRDGLPMLAMPPPLHCDWKEHESLLEEAFSGDRAYAVGMFGEQRSAPRKKPGAAVSRSKMRALVIGDALSSDLPIQVDELCERSGGRTHVSSAHRYSSAPPTPYIAYLREGCTSTQVANHSVYELGESDKLRCSMTPYFKDASWRDMAGEHGSMLHPMMMELGNQDWCKLKDRWGNKVPKFMHTGKKTPGSGMPATKQPYYNTL